MIGKHAIEALCRRLAEAHATKDADAIVGCYAPDAVVFNLAPPLGKRGLDRDEVAAWLTTWDGPIAIDTTDVELYVSGEVVSGEVGFSTAMTRMRGRQGGEARDIWFRSTLCFRQTADGWRIVHEHTSVPFYMDGSYRAAIDLTP